MNPMYTQKRYAQFRGPSTSDDYNARVDETYNDLTVLYNRARLSEVELDELYSRMVKEHLSISRAINELEERVDSIEDEQKRMVFFSADQIDNSYFKNSEFEVATEEALSYDQLHGSLTLPEVKTSTLSKLFYVNVNGEEVIPAGMETKIVGNQLTADRPGVRIDQSPVEFALYKKPGYIWERNVVSNTPNLNGAEMTVYFKVPTDLFTTDKANSVLVHGYPHFGTTIRDISYTTRYNPSLADADGYKPLNEDALYSGDPEAIGWVPPGGWLNNHKSLDAATHAGPKYFVFPPKPITAIKLTLHQDEYYEEAGKYIYSYGLSRLDLRYRKFLPEGRSILRFDAPVGETINSVIGVYPQVWNVPSDQIPEIMDFEVIWESASGSLPTLEPQPNSPAVWLQLEMKGTPDWSPVLSGLVVDYIAGTPSLIPRAASYDGGSASSTSTGSTLDGGTALPQTS